MDLIPVVVCVVAILVGIVAIFNSAKRWRWHTILAATLLLLCSAAFFVLAARTLKTHQVWMTAATRMEQAVQKIEGIAPPTAEDKDRTDNLYLAYDLDRIRTQIRDTISDRGRVWTNCKRTAGGNEAEIVVNIDQPDPHQLAEKTSVYVFDSDDQGFGSYIGEFRVSKVAGKTVTLTPIFSVDARELARIKQAAPSTRHTITLFEQMPGDSHEAFAGLNDDAIRGLLPGAPTAVLDAYLKDLQPAGINDLPENIEVRVKFLKETPIPTPPGMKAEEPKAFKEGQEVWLPLLGSAAVPGAEALIRQGAAEEVRSVPRRNVRGLREYKRVFDQAYQDRAMLKTGIAQLTRDRDAFMNAQAAAEEQIKKEEIHKTKLASDLDKLKIEAAETGKLLQTLENQWNAVRSELGRIFLANKELAEQLTNSQLKSAAELQKRNNTTAATSGSSPARIP